MLCKIVFDKTETRKGTVVIPHALKPVYGLLICDVVGEKPCTWPDVVYYSPAHFEVELILCAGGVKEGINLQTILKVNVCKKHYLVPLIPVLVS